MKTFRIKDGCGKHQEAIRKNEKKPRTYKAGDAFESEVDLAKEFPNKFERVPSQSAKQPVSQMVDVTDEFSIAAEADVSVLRKGKNQFFVMDGASPINEKGLKKSDVHTYIDRLLTKEEADDNTDPEEE